MVKKITIAVQFLVFFSSCSVVQKTAKQELTDGYYKQKANGSKQHVYVDLNGDSLRIYPTVGIGKELKVDTTGMYQFYLSTLKTKDNVQILLSKTSFDLDFLTIPLKYRFSENLVPPQLNASLNAAAYFGYRTDRYVINYKTNPLQTSERTTTHIGYSFGFFTGFGNTFMSPTNTNNALQQEYDGMVWSKGIAGIFGINRFTLGLALGFDRLLDHNEDIWIYNNKAWLGLAFGINLN